MTTTQDPFMTSGGPAITFDTPGQVSTIVVRKVTEKVDTDPATGEIKTWPNGDPKNVFVFEGDDSAGEPVSLWVRGNLVKAIREATKEAGLKTVIDTKVTVRFESVAEPTKKGLHGAKLYKAKVEQVAPSVHDTFSDGEEPF